MYTSLHSFTVRGENIIILNICVFHSQVADILGKATESVPKEEVRESNPHLKNLYEGLTMTQAQLHKVLYVV
jgi:molecular chaperone GrpE